MTLIQNPLQITGQVIPGNVLTSGIIENSNTAPVINAGQLVEDTFESSNVGTKKLSISEKLSLYLESFNENAKPFLKGFKKQAVDTWQAIKNNPGKVALAATGTVAAVVGLAAVGIPASVTCGALGLGLVAIASGKYLLSSASACIHGLSGNREDYEEALEKAGKNAFDLSLNLPFAHSTQHALHATIKGGKTAVVNNFVDTTTSVKNFVGKVNSAVSDAGLAVKELKTSARLQHQANTNKGTLSGHYAALESGDHFSQTLSSVDDAVQKMTTSASDLKPIVQNVSNTVKDETVVLSGKATKIEAHEIMHEHYVEHISDNNISHH